MIRLEQINTVKGSREDLEPAVRDDNPGLPVTYLGVWGPDRADDHWPVHVWRVGGTPWVPMVRVQEPREFKPDDKAVYRRDVYTGDGRTEPVAYARTWTEPKVHEPFPAPLTTSDQECTVAHPKPVTDIAHSAAAHGWEYMITYAHGWTPHATHGTPSAQPKQSWGVRLRRGDQRAVAVRMDGSWTAFWTWSPRRIMKRCALLADFRALLGEEW